MQYDDEIYYRIGFDGKEIKICQMQWFDESPKRDKFWITNETFECEAEAIAFLKSKILPDNILSAIKNFLSTNDAFKL
ncbi:hypothetical protein [Nostoc sp.]|uniref:hypothetical protein n=1 Tax=Nostoc sp. TaxID=1180 RepID=UPI002FFB486E